MKETKKEVKAEEKVFSKKDYIVKLGKKLEEKEKLKLIMENQYFQVLGEINFLKNEIKELQNNE